MKTKTSAHRELANTVSNETSRYVNINTCVSLYAKDVEGLLCSLNLHRETIHTNHVS